MRRERMTAEHAIYKFTVDQPPMRAGHRPYNKLVDRVADDNMIDAKRQ